MAIQTIAVIGAGLIGASWTALFIANGIQTIVYGPREDAEKGLVENIRLALTTLSKLARYQNLAPWKTLQSLVSFTISPDNAIKVADFIQENTPESLTVKLDLLHAIDTHVKPTTLICSSTSGFRPSQLQPACPRSAHNFLIGHPFNPPHLIPLVEVVGGPSTSPAAINAAMDFYTSLGKRPVHVRTEVPGDIANRLQAAVFREVFYLLGSGAADLQDIETAMEFGPGLRWGVMGPSLLLHLGGGVGGAAEYAEKFLPYLMSWYAANDPVLDPGLMEKWVTGTKEMADRLGDRGRIEARRDEMLITLLNASSRIESDG